MNASSAQIVDETLQVSAEHGVQPPGKLTGGAVGDGRLAGGDDAVRELVLLRQLRGQWGVTKPAFCSGFGAKTRGHEEETQGQKVDRCTQAHSCYLRAVSP